MVFKGPSVTEAKARRFSDRKDRSICVKFTKRELSKPFIAALVATIHNGIERVYFPRQKHPRFFFVLCKDKENKDKAFQKILKYKNEELGKLIPKKIKDFPRPVIEKKKNLVDPLTIVLEGLPKKLESTKLEKEFPNCTKFLRFNGARAYINFSTVQDAFGAFKRVKSEVICGHKLSVRFNKKNEDDKTDKSSGKPENDSEHEEESNDSI